MEFLSVATKTSHNFESIKNDIDTKLFYCQGYITMPCNSKLFAMKIKRLTLCSSAILNCFFAPTYRPSLTFSKHQIHGTAMKVRMQTKTASKQFYRVSANIIMNKQMTWSYAESAPYIQKWLHAGFEPMPATKLQRARLWSHGSSFPEIWLTSVVIFVYFQLIRLVTFMSYAC